MKPNGFQSVGFKQSGIHVAFLETPSHKVPVLMWKQYPVTILFQNPHPVASDPNIKVSQAYLAVSSAFIFINDPLFVPSQIPLLMYNVTICFGYAIRALCLAKTMLTLVEDIWVHVFEVWIWFHFREIAACYLLSCTFHPQILLWLWQGLCLHSVTWSTHTLAKYSFCNPPLFSKLLDTEVILPFCSGIGEFE